jgi:hypothetical protein
MITGWGANSRYHKIHYYRDLDGRPLCGTKGRKMGTATLSIKNWNPEHPNTCPKCKEIMGRIGTAIGKTSMSEAK